MANRPSTNTNTKNALPLEGIYTALILLIENNIHNFPDFLNEAVINYKSEPALIVKEKIVQEDDITLPFGRFFRNLTSDYDFEPQSKTPETNATTDIGIIAKKFSKHRVICFVEAKRLPIPKPYSNDRQETEYVCYHNSAKQGGIERFKTGKHAGKEKLNFSLMLGYIQENNASHWHTQINKWINEQVKSPSNLDLTWTKQDKLVIDNSFKSNCVSKFKSTHKKISEETINLLHYWIDLTK